MRRSPAAMNKPALMALQTLSEEVEEMLRNSGSENWRDAVMDEFYELSVELEALENILIAYECGAQFCKDNPKYDQPDMVIVFRNLRRIRRDLDEKISEAGERLIKLGFQPTKTAQRG